MSNATDLQEKGIKLFQQKEFEAAAGVFKEAHAAFEADEQTDMAAEMLVNTGLVHRALGEHEEAITLMQQALDVFSEMDDQNRIAQVLGNLGGVFAAQGDTEQAITCYRQAADTFKALGEDEHYGQTLVALGDLQVRSGNVMTGAVSYEVGIENIENPSGTQKLLKRMLGVKNRLLNQQLPDVEESGDEE